ncbi:MAG: DUF4123 domain-containing protein [Chitinophagales bacterium]
MKKFLIIDGAKLEEMLETALKKCSFHESLYRSNNEDIMPDVAPYLLRTNNGSKFMDWYLTNGWKNSWGFLMESKHAFKHIHRHLRRFLLVKTEDGKKLYFRFYDPRVLRVFLPTCDKYQLEEFFGPIDAFIVEDEDPEYALKFRVFRGELRTERILAEELFQKENENANVNY